MDNIIIWGILLYPECHYAEYSYGDNDMKYRKAKICYDDPDHAETAYIRVKGNKKYYLNHVFARHDIMEG